MATDNGHMSFQDKLNRIADGRTWKALNEKAKTPRAEWNKKGKPRDPYKALLLADALGVDPWWLFNDKDDRDKVTAEQGLHEWTERLRREGKLVAGLRPPLQEE